MRCLAAARSAKRNGRGGAHQLEYDKYKSAQTLQEAVRLGAGQYLASDAAVRRMVVVVGWWMAAVPPRQTRYFPFTVLALSRARLTDYKWKSSLLESVEWDS